MNLKKLSEILKQTNRFFKSKATSAVNISLTMRNWLFGFYIVEYEQKGEDRAIYGDKILTNLVNILNQEIKEISLTYLISVRKFYFTYPQIGQTVSDLLSNSSQLYISGNGFCFEACQKRILIGDEYYYIDLVFYHRILRCYILTDLKVDDFSHEYAGQLNAYVN